LCTTEIERATSRSADSIRVAVTTICSNASVSVSWAQDTGMVKNRNSDSSQGIRTVLTKSSAGTAK